MLSITGGDAGNSQTCSIKAQRIAFDDDDDDRGESLFYLHKASAAAPACL